MKLINLVKTSACTLALGCAAYAASAHTVDGSSTAQMGLSALQSPLDTLKPQDLNNPKQKEVIRQAISQLKGPNGRHHGHLNKKIALVEKLIALSDDGKTLPAAVGVALTVRPAAQKEVIDLFALTYADLTIPGVAERLLSELGSNFKSASYQEQGTTKSIVDFWTDKVAKTLTERYPEKFSLNSGYSVAWDSSLPQTSFPTWSLTEYVAGITKISTTDNSPKREPSCPVMESTFDGKGAKVTFPNGAIYALKYVYLTSGGTTVIWAPDNQIAKDEALNDRDWRGHRSIDATHARIVNELQKHGM